MVLHPTAHRLNDLARRNRINRNAQYVVVVNKEGSGEGACQVYVADDIYRTLFHL